jgi:glycosyltransferase involved in cell wall biosynthesis
MSKTVISVFWHHPTFVRSMEAYMRELSVQLERLGWKHVLVFAGPPSPEVRRFLDLPNNRLEVIERCGERAWGPMFKMAGLLVRVRPQIVHLHFIDARAGYPWLAKLLMVRSVYMTDHISRPEGYSYRRGAMWRRIASRLLHVPVRKTFCVSSYVRQCNTDEGAMCDGRLALLYNGVDCGRAERGAVRRHEVRRRYGIADDEVLVLQVSWLIPEKGIGDLLRAAQRVVAKNDKIRFLIAGEGTHRAEYEIMAEQLGISNCVTFVGQVDDPFGVGLYAASDIVCQLSRWEEAFGLTIAEAMASRKPVIATRVGGIPELVRHGQSGFLVEPGDVNAMAETILLLAQSPELRISMGLTGRELCNRNFDVVKQVDSLICMYGISKTEDACVS